MTLSIHIYIILLFTLISKALKEKSDTLFLIFNFFISVFFVFIEQ